MSLLHDVHQAVDEAHVYVASHWGEVWRQASSSSGKQVLRFGARVWGAAVGALVGGDTQIELHQEFVQLSPFPFVGALCPLNQLQPKPPLVICWQFHFEPAAPQRSPVGAGVGPVGACVGFFVPPMNVGPTVGAAVGAKVGGEAHTA